MSEGNDIFSQEPEAPARRNFVRYFKKPWVILAASLLVAALAVAFSINRIMLTLLHSRPEVVVPKLEGRSLMEALAIVSPMDLSLQQEGTDFDESLPAGTILRQYPPSGMQVRAGRSIRITISKGGQVVFIPSVTGKPLAEAQSMLAADGIQMGSVSELYSIDSVKNVVLSQNPSSGTIVTRGAFVDIEVSKGPPPVGLPILPNFLGKSVDSAREWGTGVNVQVKVKEDKFAVGAPGIIVKQDPIHGQPLLEDQDIQVTIVPLTSAKGKRFSYQVPGDQKETMVRIMARDDKGETKVYEGKHAGGATVEIPVDVKAATRFRVYLDDVLKDEKVVEPQ